MKILFVNHIYLETELSGTTQRQIVGALNRLGHQTMLVVPTVSSDTTALPGDQVQRVSMPSAHPAFSTPIFNLKLLARLARDIRRERPDVVVVDHCSAGGAAPFMALSAFSRRLPRFIFDVRSQPVEGQGVIGALRELQYLIALAICARLVQGVTFLTRPMGRRELRRVRSHRAYGVWESGVDLELFARGRWAAAAAELRRELGLADRFVVLYHGDLSWNRGLETAVQAFARFDQAGPGPKPVLVLLGDGEARGGLERLARETGSEVRFLGRVPYDDVPGFVAMCDVALIPLPDHEDWRYQHPLKYTECLAAGVPVIVSRIPAFTDIAKESRAVRYLEDTTPEAIEQEIVYCLAHREEIGDWGSEGRRLAEQYSWERVAERLVSYAETI